MKYGRRILKFTSNLGREYYTISGQWVGHSYGDSRGTKRQIRNATPFIGDGSVCEEKEILEFQGSSDKIFWNIEGTVGELVAMKKDELWWGDKELVQRQNYTKKDDQILICTP